jgi:aryl-alcohol dehydrogenase-like predicted oxidoreductase
MAMKKRTLGKSGFEVSEVGLGCWQLGGDFGPVGDAQAREILATAHGCGINFWDTADVYGGGLSEERIARYLGDSDAEALVATKVGRNASLYPDGYSKEEVRASIEGSARRLGVETIDLIQLHCVPFDVLKDGEIFAWLEDFQEEGLIRAFGASVETLEEARLAAVQPGLTSLQIIFNLFRQDAIESLFPLAEANDVGIIVRLPLASGVLSGKMKPGQTFAASDHRQYNREGQAFSRGETFSGIPFETALGLVENMRRWTPDGMNLAEMAMRWILDQPAVSTVIAGATRPEQVRQNAGASDLATLPGALHEKLAEFYQRQVRPEIRVPV